MPYLAEPRRWVEYLPNVVERSLLDDKPVAPGSKWKAVDRIGPLRWDFTDELVEISALERVVFRHSSPWNATSVFEIASAEGGSEVHHEFEGDMSGKLTWLDLIPDSMARRQAMRDLKRLERHLDTKPTSS